MTEERIPTYIPGDEIGYQIVFVCPFNIETVTVAFRHETTGSEIILTGEAYLIEKPRLRDARTQGAALLLDNEASDEPETGRYYLARLEAQTYRGKPLDFDNPPEAAFYFKDDPSEIADKDLPKIARGIVEPAAMFLFPKGHPNTPPPA